MRGGKRGRQSTQCIVSRDNSTNSDTAIYRANTRAIHTLGPAALAPAILPLLFQDTLLHEVLPVPAVLPNSSLLSSLHEIGVWRVGVGR